MTMGMAEEEDELGSMPPLPRPKARPSPVSLAGSRSTSAGKPSARVVQSHEDDDVMTESPPPTPHPQPLRRWKHSGSDERSGTRVRGGAANGGAPAMEHLHRPLRSRQVDTERLNPAFLSRDRVAAFVHHEDDGVTDPGALEIVPHSTLALENRIHQVENLRLEPRPLTEGELRYAATEASRLRQLGYTRMDPANQRLITAQPPPGEPDTALERARMRKVKKQVDARWLEQRNDPTLRPVGPLEREDERSFYDSVYQVSLQEILDEGVLFDDQDLEKLLTIEPFDHDDLAFDTRGTTGLPGCCFDEWSFTRRR